MYQEVINIPCPYGLPWRFVQFDSVAEFVTPKTEGHCPSIWKHNVINKFKEGGAESWFGCRTQEELETILSRGKRKYLDLVTEQMVSVTQPMTLRRRRLRADAGDELDIHRVYAGDLSTAWGRMSKRERVGVRNIHLVINGTVSAARRASEIQWIGVAALRLAEAFEKAGYRIAIDMTYGATRVSSEESICLMVPVKTYEAPLDLMSLSSCTCFPGFYRACAFMNWGYAKGEMSFGLGGQPDDSQLKNHVLPRFYTNPNEIVELISKDTLSKQACENEVARILDRYGREEAMAA